MWRVFNFLFGWDYVSWQNSAANGIARVHKTPDGTVYYYRYKIINLIDTIKHSSEPHRAWDTKIIWLTCTENKYFGVK